MVQNPCGAPVVVAHAVVRGVAAPVVVVVAEARRGAAAVEVAAVDAEVRAAAAARDVPHLQVNGEVPRRGASPFASK